MPHAVAQVFVFTVMPSPASPYHGKFGLSIADVWIIGKPQAEAEAAARSHIMDQGWIVNSLDRSLQISEADIGTYRSDAQATFHQAKRFGLGAVFVTSPLVERDDNVIEVHRMKPPLSPPGTQQ